MMTNNAEATTKAMKQHLKEMSDLDRQYKEAVRTKN
jgi:hypothetical protein